MTNQPVSIAQEPWQTTNLERLGSFYGGLSGKSKEHFGSGRAQYVPFVNVMANLRIDPNALEQVDVADNEYQNPVRFGDLLFNGSSETPEEVGLCSVIDFEPGKLFLNSFCFGFRPFSLDHFDGVFFAYLFRSSIGRQIMVGLAQGSTRYNLSKPKLLAAELLVPSVQEQRSIAALLTDVDLEIDSLDALIAKKRNIKQGAMQQLLTGKTRLPGFNSEWISASLGSISQVVMGQSPLGQYYNTNGEGLPLIQGNADVSSRQTYVRTWTTQSPKTCEKGEVIMTVRAPVGYVARAHAKIALGRGVCAFRNPTIDNDFLYQALIFAENVWEAISQGTTFTAANANEVNSFKLLVPSDRVEQSAIAEVLMDMDTEIDSLVARREKSALIKIGMMQELLTGRTRLL